jgi:hypothetical protein
MLAFVSPSGDGLKLVYALKQKISSLKEYSDFYKSFSRKLASQFNIEAFVDFKTSDATRICFLSYDINLYYNKNAELVDANKFISDYDIFNSKLNNREVEDSSITNNEKAKISNSQYKDILSKLNPKPPKKTKNYIVPEVLYTVSAELIKTFADNNLAIDDVSDINYGRKFRVKDGSAFAVFNLYYGSRGFTVVKTPVRGSNKQLLDVSVAICEHVIYTEKETEVEQIKNIQYAQGEKRFAHNNDRVDEKKEKGRIIKLKAIS